MVGNPEFIIREITGFAAGTASAGIPRGGGETPPPLSKTPLRGLESGAAVGRSTPPKRATFNFPNLLICRLLAEGDASERDVALSNIAALMLRRHAAAETTRVPAQDRQDTQDTQAGHATFNQRLLT